MGYKGSMSIEIFLLFHCFSDKNTGTFETIYVNVFENFF